MTLPRPDADRSGAGTSARAAEAWGAAPDLTSISSTRSIRLSRSGLPLPSPTGAEASDSEPPRWVMGQGPWAAFSKRSPSWRRLWGARSRAAACEAREGWRSNERPKSGRRPSPHVAPPPRQRAQSNHISTAATSRSDAAVNQAHDREHHLPAGEARVLLVPHSEKKPASPRVKSRRQVCSRAVPGFWKNVCSQRHGAPHTLSSLEALYPSLGSTLPASPDPGFVMSHSTLRSAKRLHAPALHP